MKAVLIILFTGVFIFLIYGLLPSNLFIRLNDQPNEVVICPNACTCAQARIIKGELEIPSAILATQPKLNKYQLNFENGGRVWSINKWDMYDPVLLRGVITGVDTIECGPQFCDITPVMKVTYARSYSSHSRFLNFTGWALAVYLIIICVVFLFILTGILKIIQRLTKS